MGNFLSPVRNSQLTAELKVIRTKDLRREKLADKLIPYQNPAKDPLTKCR